MADVYYKIDGTTSYFTNENKTGYTKRSSSYPSDNKTVIIELYNDKFIFPVNSAQLFRGAKNTTFNDIDKWDTSECTNMSLMFYGCSSLTSIDCSTGDVSNVTTMSEMFYGCSAVTSINIDGGDTSNVTDFSQTFYTCRALTSLDTSVIDTSAATNMSEMFSGCRSITEINVVNGDVSKVTNMNYMFGNCVELTKIIAIPNTNWANGAVTSSSSMFVNDTKLPNYTSSAVTVARANNTAYGGYFTGFEGEWVYYKVVGNDVYLCNQQLDGYSPCTDFTYKKYIINNTGLKTFRDVHLVLTDDKFTLPINAPKILFGCSNSLDNLDKVDASACKTMVALFSDTREAVLDLSTGDFSSVENMNYFCFSELNLEQLIFPQGDFKNVKSMKWLVTHTGEIKTLNLSMFKNSPIEDLEGAFFQTSLETVYIPFTDYSNLKNVTSCFIGATKIKNVYVVPDTNWAVGTNLPKDSEGTLIDYRIFGPTAEEQIPLFDIPLPNYDYHYLTQDRANTILGYGYFQNMPEDLSDVVYFKTSEGWTIRTVYEKQLGTWTIVNVFSDWGQL